MMLFFPQNLAHPIIAPLSTNFWCMLRTVIISVNATTDFPSNPEIKVKPTLPLMPFSGFYSVYDSIASTTNLCNAISPPAGNDAGYSCPSAGLYNFGTDYHIWGDPHAWYGNIYGINMGVDVDFLDSYTKEKWATCFVTVRIREGEDEYVYNNAAFIGGATAALTGLAAGLMYKRRRILIEGEDNDAALLDRDESPTNYELTVV